MSNFCWRISQCFFIFDGWYPHTGETIYSRFPDSLLYTCLSACEYPMPVCDSTQSFTMFQVYGFSYSNHNFPHWIDLSGGLPHFQTHPEEQCSKPSVVLNQLVENRILIMDHDKFQYIGQYNSRTYHQPTGISGTVLIPSGIIKRSWLENPLPVEDWMRKPVIYIDQWWIFHCHDHKAAL
jgi:hypothetical protein